VRALEAKRARRDRGNLLRDNSREGAGIEEAFLVTKAAKRNEPTARNSRDETRHAAAVVLPVE